MLTTSSKIVRAKAQHLVDRFWLSKALPLEDYEIAKHCAVVAVEEMYHGPDKSHLIEEILNL